MKKWLKSAVAGTLLLGALTAGTSAYAAGSAQLQVFIDGKLQDKAILFNGNTMVQLIAFNDPSWVSYSYDTKTKTVVITNTVQNMTIMLQENAVEANVNGTRVKLDAPVQIISGRTYVPLRFLSETLGGKVDYNTASRQAVVRTPSGETGFQKLMKGTLAEARNAAINLSKIPLDKELSPLGEGFSETFTFPKGEALRFTMEYKSLISYIEISPQGLAEVKWQKDTWSENGKYREIGIKPKAFGESVVFIYNIMTPEITKYGTVGSDGKVGEMTTYAVTEKRQKSGQLIDPVEGEQRTDQQK